MSKLYSLPLLWQIAGNRRLRVPLNTLFLSTAVLGSLVSRAQTPGGIPTAPSVWYKPDGATATTWTDVSGNNINLSTNGAGTVTVNAGDAAHNFNSWTTGYSSANYYLHNSSTNAVFGAWGDTSGNYRYTALTVFGAAKANTAGNGAITGLDNDVSYGAEPGFGVQASGGILHPRSYRFGNGYNAISASQDIPLGQTSVYLYQPPPGNASAGTGNLIFGLNGAKSVTPGVSARSSVAGPHVNIGYDGFTFGAFPGDIQEVVWYKATLDTADIARVETYLAIKYGATLAHDYVSNIGTLYNLGTNSGYTSNIAGIMRDSASALHQKQSNSVNTGKQLLIGTTGLAGTNDANTGTLTNGQALIWGDNGLAKIPSISVTNIPGTNYRFASVWKAQNTGSVGTVRVAWPSVWATLKLVQSSDPTFASGNTITDMTGNTQTINGITYNYADVTLADGQYFTFAAFVQAPGGVVTAAWYRTDAPGTLFSDAGITPVTDSTALYQWNEYTGNGYNLSQATAGLRPLFSNAKTLVNFNPTVTFNNDYMGGQPATGQNIIDRADGTLYAAGYTNTLTNCGFFGFDESNDYPGLHIFGSQHNLLFFTGGPGYQGISANAFTDNAYFIAGGSWQNGGGTTAAYAAATASLNGNRADYSGTQLQNAVLDNNARDIRIGQDNNYGTGLNGQLNELIIFENKLTSDQMDQLESYLAIKYGTTYANGNRNYRNSTGDTMWTAATNSNYKNSIAGIARDDNGALYQKQSWSVDMGKQVLIGTTGLANTNAANSGSLTNGQYLIWGDNGLAKSPAMAITGVAGVNYRFGAVWKVQNTNNVGTVRVAWPKMFTTMKLMQSMDTTFDGTDVITNMSDTQVVNGTTYAYADVTLSNGQYFTFSAFVQAPGGVVANILMWHKADDGVTVAGAKSTWRDVSVNGRDVTQNNNATYQPALVTASADTADGKVYFFNYNPFYYFDGTNDFFYRQNDSYFPVNTSAGSAYGVMFHSASGGWRTAFGWGDDDPNIVRGNDEYYITRDNGTVITQNVNAGEIPAHIGGFSWKGSGAANNGVYLNVNGRTYGTTTYNIGTIDDNFAVGSEGFGLTGNGNEVFQGGIPEVFAYSADHQNSGGDEKLRINSYLAIKYGITLSNDSGTAVPNYLSSTSAVVWNAAANTGYNNNIAGLAYDYNSALQQKQSISENAGKQVLIGTTGLANTNALNATALATDGQFLIWGDNGLAKTPAIYMPGLINVNVRFKSIWKVQNTGSVGTVRVAWPAAGLNNLSLMQSTDTSFDASDAITNMSANTQTVNGVAYNYADVTLSNGQYFTFATHIEHAPGGVFAGLSYWYRADKDVVNTGDSTSVTSWTDYAMGTVANQVGTNPYPLYHAGNATYLNFNPGINFTDGNQSLGNLLAQTVADTAYDIFTLTKEGITAGGANARIFSVLSNKSLTTGNIHYWDGIGINYDGRLERYNSTSGLSYLANPGSVNFPAYSPGIMYHTFTNNTVSKGLNGAPNGTSSVSGPYGMIDGGFIFGSTVFSGNGSDNYSFRGNLGETIIYGSNNISSAERNRIDAYLAIKYGVTLDTARSYLSSGSEVIWDKNANKLHYNNVAGIGRDDLSALFQKQSRSQVTNNPNNQVTMGLGNIYNTNTGNPDSVANGQFLVWGDNGNTQAMTNVATTYTAFTYNSSNNNRRMKRTWKVQNTNVGSALKIRFPVASVGTTTLPDESCAQYVILFADDTAFTTNVSAAALVVNGTNYDATHNFPGGASYFTFARLSSFTPGVVYLPDTTEATNEVGACASGAWSYFHRTGDISRKVLATSGLTTAQIDDLTVTVTPEGAGYNNGVRVTRLMDRITTVADVSNGTYPGARVRVYYSSNELAAAQVPGAVTQSWFRYNSYNADTIKTDIQADGVFNPGKAIALTPVGSGIEDGVPYVEFLNASPFASFVYVSSTETVGVVLPVTLLNFTAHKQGAGVVLNWATARESGNKGFSLERSEDSRSWRSIGFVNSAAPYGNSNEKLDYTYTDRVPMNGINYYRLKQTDVDGQYRYSVVRQVSFGQRDISIHPNPASNYVTVDGLSGGEQIKMYDATGRMIREIKTVQSSVMIDLTGLSDGLYNIHITGDNGTIVSRKVVKVN